jgi:predicted TIM-barrel fold metal-dependent hydrolase
MSTCRRLPIFDVRCRVTVKEAGEYFSGRQKSGNKGPRIKAFESGTIEGFFDEISEAGVTTAVSVSGNNPGLNIGKWKLAARTTSNDLMADLQRRHWGKIIGVAGIDAGNTYHDALSEIRRSHGLGLRAVFIEPGRSPGCNLDDRRLYPIYELCSELDMTLMPQTSGILGAKSIDYANPVHLDQVAEDFPTLRIIAGHGCYPYVREAIVVAARRENVFMSPDSLLFDLGTEDWLKAVNSHHFGIGDQFLFGSAYPLIEIQPYVEKFLTLPWSDEVLPKILHRNALRAFKLDTDPVFTEMYGV